VAKKSSPSHPVEQQRREALMRQTVETMLSPLTRMFYWARRLCWLELGRSIPCSDDVRTWEELLAFSRAFLMATRGLSPRVIGKMDPDEVMLILREEVLERETMNRAHGATPTGADGPAPPDLVWWQGKPYRFQNRSWQIISYLWGKPAVEVQELSDAVWGEDREVEDQTIRTAISRASTELLQAGVPFRVTWVRGYVYLRREV
jgi:hypothetical protein